MDFVAQQSRRTRPKVYAAILGALFLISAAPLVLAHGGHGDEFKGHTKATAGSIQVDAATAIRMGLKVVPVLRQRLALGIKTTGQIETMSNRRVEVTPPITGTVIQLLV